MRSKVSLAAVAVVGLSLSGASGGQPTPDPLAQLLTDGALAKTRNPVPAAFLLNEGGSHLTAEQRDIALGQLREALHVQTSLIRVMMQGATGMMNSDEMKKQMEDAKKNSGTSGFLKSMLGMPPRQPPPSSGERLAQEAKQAMIDPWVRGIEAARALDQAGDSRGAAAFYVNCFQMLQADWVPSACLDGLLDLGPRKAGLVLNWMLDNADTISISAPGAFGAPPPPKSSKAPPDRGAQQLRQFALEGLGILVGTGRLEPDARESAVSKLLAYASGKENEPFNLGAALGLGRSRDPRAAEALRSLAKDSRTDVREAAWRGLAVAFHDDAAIKKLRSQLGARDLEAQLRAAQALFEIGDETALHWAVETIGHRRTSDARQPDIRPEVVRRLVELGGAPARHTLEQALAAGTGNDWLEAWVRVGLLELGDASQMPAVEAAVAKEDWALDPRGFRSVWRAIKPLLLAAAQTVVSGGMAAPSAFNQARQAVQLIGNFASGERGRFLANADARRAAIAQLRWQTADALGLAHPPGAEKLLVRLLDDPAAPVRLSAARALASLESPEAIAGVETAFGRDYGDEDGESRTAEVRAALLRAAVIRFPRDQATRTLLLTAASDPDPGVRFIALTALRPAA
ncbi:MAG: HEAT repeat domain-containing protein [Acidobacteriota bacterium]